MLISSFFLLVQKKIMVKKMNASKTSNMLPEGWLVITKYRKRGSSKGQRDRTYYSPDMQRFRSLVAVNRFLAANTATTAPEADEDEEKEEIEDNLIVQQQNDVVKLTIVSASSSSQALDDSSNSNDVIVIDSSSSDDDDDSLWM
jgi:ribonuclease I